MTVIAWDGRRLAVDSQLTHGGFVREYGRKLWKYAGFAITGTGDYDRVIALRDWYVAGAKFSEYPEFQRSPDTAAILVVATDRGVAYFGGPTPTPIELFVPWAWGCGREVALGAMFAGGDADMAVRAAIRYCEGCGGEVQSYGE